MSGILGAGRCEPCVLGNHTGTNGTAGCEGPGCACSCRRQLPPRPAGYAGCDWRSLLEQRADAERAGDDEELQRIAAEVAHRQAASR